MMINLQDIEKGLDFGRKAEYELKKSGEDKSWQILAEGYRKSVEDLLIELKQYRSNPDLTRDRVYKLCNKHRWFTSGGNSQYMAMFDMVDAKATTREIAMVIWICSDREKWTVESIQKILDEPLYCAVLRGEVHYIGEFEDVQKFLEEDADLDAQTWTMCEYRKEA